ncbi:MAG TPA: PaaI family thioesterase [Hyphomicrobiaceae bacterium]|nr:PaaI family thioesterase [Hyphomicrobiaceae bacterium]
MSDFEPKDPDYRARVEASFSRQQAMHSLGIELADIGRGRVVLSMPYRAEYCQQHGFVHAGIISTALDSACGYAAFSLMPAGAEVLTIEFKTNLLAPAKGEMFIFRAAVVKPGRTVTVCEAQAYAVSKGDEKLITTMTGTLMAIFDRQDVRPLA